MTDIVIGKHQINLLQSERYSTDPKSLYTMTVTFSEDWEDFKKYLIFKTDMFEKTVAISGMCETFPIPLELFKEPSSMLQVRAHGQNCNDTLVTQWMPLGQIWKNMPDSKCNHGHPKVSVPFFSESIDLLKLMIERKADRLTYQDDMLTLWSGEDPLSSFELKLGSIFPTGGTKNQVLAKASDTDNDLKWMTIKDPAVNIVIPKGMIFLWFGPVGLIPPGYSLCDGQNGTIDLRDVFIVGDTDQPSDMSPEPSSYILAFVQKTSFTAMDFSGGLSAYEIAVENGFEGTEEQWLDSLKGGSGEAGKSAYEIAVDHGFEGTESEWLESLKGESSMYGKSAYEIAIEYGFVGTVPEWLESLKGAGGKSAYQIALDHGFEGTEAEWLESLKGERGENGLPGKDGASAYDIAVQNGFEGSEEQWLDSLKGISVPSLSVIENKTISSRNDMPKHGTGSYIFRNVILISEILSRSTSISGYSFPDDVVYVNMDYESQITIDTLDNKHFTCILSNDGKITNIQESQNEQTDYILPATTAESLGGVMITTASNPAPTKTALKATANGKAFVDWDEAPRASTTQSGLIKLGDGFAVDEATGAVKVVASDGNAPDTIDWSIIQNKPDIALKSDISNVYTYKGSVSNYDSLPETDLTVGDVYNVEATGMNYAWTGLSWDSLGGNFSVASISDADIDALFNYSA